MWLFGKAAMSSLKGAERIQFEKFFGMGSGYVCNFSDRSFGDFVLDITGIDVYRPEYAEGGTSKANRLRTLWRKASNQTVAKLMREMLAYCKAERESSQGPLKSADAALHSECFKVIERL